MIRLIDNLSQVLTAASINVSNSIENWFPYIDEAQETFIKPVLGNVLYDQLPCPGRLKANRYIWE